MNLEYFKVSLFEINNKNNFFKIYNIFLDVCIEQCYLPVIWFSVIISLQRLCCNDINM